MRPTNLAVRTLPYGFVFLFILAFWLSVTGMAVAQTRAAKESKTKSEPGAGQPADSSSKDSSSRKDEDPLFKGMKYRVIGPFRGGRSLTASGIAGDPTTYY